MELLKFHGGQRFEHQSESSRLFLDWLTMNSCNKQSKSCWSSAQNESRVNVAKTTAGSVITMLLSIQRFLFRKLVSKHRFRLLHWYNLPFLNTSIIVSIAVDIPRRSMVLKVELYLNRIDFKTPSCASNSVMNFS